MEMKNVEPILLTIRSLAEQLIKLIDVITDSAKIVKEVISEDKVVEVKEEPKKEVTLIEVRTALAKLSKEGYTNDVKALLNKYGAEKLSAVNPNDYEAILKDAEVLNNGK